MEAATRLGLPWRLLRDKLAPPDPDAPITDVNYKKTLEMLETDLIVSSKKETSKIFNKNFVLVLIFRKPHMLDQRQ